VRRRLPAMQKNRDIVRVRRNVFGALPHMEFHRAPARRGKLPREMTSRMPRPARTGRAPGKRAPYPQDRMLDFLARHPSRAFGFARADAGDRWRKSSPSQLRCRSASG